MESNVKGIVILDQEFLVSSRSLKVQIVCAHKHIKAEVMGFSSESGILQIKVAFLPIFATPQLPSFAQPDE